MNAPKIIAIIVGILLTAAGIFFFVSPGQGFFTLVLILGIVMIVDGVSNIVRFIENKGRGHSDIWSLLGAILSLIAGIILVTNHFSRFFVGRTILIILAIWILARGVFQIFVAISAGRFAGSMGAASSVMLVVGLLMVVAGIIFIINPLLLEGIISVVVSLILIFGGVSLVAAGISMPA